jgi:hypothetical protein
VDLRSIYPPSSPGISSWTQPIESGPFDTRQTFTAASAASVLEAESETMRFPQHNNFSGFSGFWTTFPNLPDRSVSMIQAASLLRASGRYHGPGVFINIDSKLLFRILHRPIYFKVALPHRQPLTSTATGPLLMSEQHTMHPDCAICSG